MASAAPFAALAVAAALALPAQAQPGPPDFDADGDGRVTRAEYRTVTAREIARFDHDRDGRVSQADLPAFTRLPGVRGQVARLWKSYDASGDGVVTREEALARAGSRFDALDADGDGHLSPAEIRAGRRR